jgi:mRNA interferase MazF
MNAFRKIILNLLLSILPLRVIVPLTDWKERYSVAPWMVAIAPEGQNGLAKPSAADAFQIHPVSQERFVQRIGELNLQQLEQIFQAVQIVIGTTCRSLFPIR